MGEVADSILQSLEDIKAKRGLRITLFWLCTEVEWNAASADQRLCWRHDLLDRLDVTLSDYPMAEYCIRFKPHGPAA